MGFFGKIFEALGFYSEEEENKPKKKEREKKMKASYDLKKQERSERIDNIDGIKVYYPEKFDECKKLYDIFKLGDPIIINFSYTDEVDVEKIKAYFSGVCDATNVKFISISGEVMYILLPEGVEIEN